MPIYTGILIIPPNTQQTNPQTLEIEIEEKTILQFEVFFPAGCNGLVNVAVFYGSEQIAPKPQGVGLIGNNETVSWPELWKTPEQPCTIRFEGWSPNTYYTHIIPVRIITRPSAAEKAEERRTLSENLIIKFLKKIVGVRT